MHNLRNITLTEENTIRFECRKQYREDGTITNPHDRGSIESLVWGDEATKIELEHMQSC